MSNGKRLLELVLPGALTGFAAGVVAGGLAAVVGQPAGWALATMLTLGIPLAVFGGGYSWLLATGRVRLGGFAPAALYWLVAFPVARLLHEAMVHLVLGGGFTLPDDILGFLAYQGIVSAGFAIGFLWLHERLAPRWWTRVGPNNPEAAAAVDRYLAHARTIRRRA